MSTFDLAELVHPNIFKPDDANHSTNDVSNFASIRCPHCLHIGAFGNALSRSLHYVKHVPSKRQAGQLLSVQLHAAIRRCPNEQCRAIVLVIMRGEQVINVSPPERLDFIPDNIPGPLVATMQEAVTCHASGAYRASALMVRRLMEELCQEQGATGPNLHQRLLALQSNMTLSGDLINGAMALKALGNDAAHVEAKAYAAIGPEEAELSIQVAKEILKALYQHKSLIDRLQKLQKTP